MGRIATDLADVTIVTSDNPRTEVPGQIIDDIVSGIQSEKIRRLAVSALAAGGRADGYLVSADRKEAIRLGLMACRPGDMLLIAGKGHETYQILGKLKVLFDDRAETIAALSELQ
jgi:UDP-N-acetylmuramyl tripeptide synthase